MTDKIEQALSEGMEEALGVREMAQKLAPRGVITDTMRGVPSLVSTGTVEAKLQAIEKLIAEIRVVSSQVKGLLG
jgi:hypothetical protein